MSHTPVLLRRGTLLTMALTVALLAAGCGSSDPAEETSTSSSAAGADTADVSATTTAQDNGDGSEEGGDGCELISDDLVTDILGIDVARREPHTDPTTGGVSCIKGTERVTDLTQSSYVSVSATPGGAAFFDQTIEGAGTESVTGVGDRAEFLADAASLIIAAGEYLVTVQVVKGGVPSSLDDCLTVADEVLDNL